MKKYFLAIAAILLFTAGVYSQDASVKPNNEQITAVDKMVREIQTNLNSYTKTEVMKDASAYRHVYKKGNALQQITVFQKDENLDKLVSWYFRNGQMIYSEQTWTDRISNQVADHQKFYMTNEHLTAWFMNGTWVDAETVDFQITAAQVTAYASKLKADSMK